MTTGLIKIGLFTLAMWISTIGLLFHCVPVWLTAVKTGRWLLSNGRSYYFPSKYYTFSIYDRVSNPRSFRLAVAILPIFFLFLLMVCASLTALLFHQVVA
jgi:hypothetical protein